MQQAPQQRSRKVFVGNLPFDYTEEQLIETFSSVGPVVSFRLVFDHATGKPKGFGFCEYTDPETAASALRNLQGVEVGGRQLRLDFADTDDAPPSKRGMGGPMGGGMGGGGPQGAPVPHRALPPGLPLIPGTPAMDSITETLAAMPPGQLLDIMSQMKALVTTSPADARALLTSNPQLSYALFQAMLMMNIVQPDALAKMQPPQAPSIPPAQPSYSGSNTPQYNNSPGPSSYHGRGPPQSYPTSQPPQASYRGPPPSAQQQGYGNYQGQQQQPPSGGPPKSSYGGPAQPALAAPPAAPAAAAAPDQAALIAQVLSMTQAQIDALPEESRNTIMLIRAQAAALPGARR